ncbi:MAG: YgiQ family radical SAM protein [Bacteriovoracaceae bacterium]|nr:YgiQ family radical SAM protein [Bacteriovoracaceae bacterium]
MNNHRRHIIDWLPTTKDELKRHNIEQLDVILLSGDAYVDHPSFGHAVVGRIIQSLGLTVGIITQPNWRDDLRDFKKLGVPKYFFGVTSGCMDSMVNHYTAAIRKRSNDAYTAGAQAGFRPNNATVVYTKILKELFPNIPVVIGGIEASLRRVTHYDYWSDKLKASIVSESGADLLVYGMGELPIKEIVNLLQKGVPFESLKTIPQTAFLQVKDCPLPKNKRWETFQLASHEECLRNKRAFAKNFTHIEGESNKQKGRRLVQHIDDKALVINPPFAVMTKQQIDASFDLPFTYLPHPKYKKRGKIPAYEMIKFSVNTHRGCFGGCSFCTISAHQGKLIASRSQDSILKELEKIVTLPGFKGHLSDLGGPSANMYKMEGKDVQICNRCKSNSCIYPHICRNLNIDHQSIIELLQTVLKKKEVKSVFIGSGIRYDLVMEDKDSGNTYLKQVAKHHVSGRLKVAPEHTEDGVLKMMRKPSFNYFMGFKKRFEKYSQQCGLKQQIIPYFISGHPGCHMKDMAYLSRVTAKLGYRLEQVQDFTPTPMTLSTVMYYTGIDPYSGKELFVPSSKTERANQRKFLFWYKKENFQWIKNMYQKFKIK